MRARGAALSALAMVLVLCFASGACAASVDSVLQRWTKKLELRDDMGQELYINVTYYSAEYVEALVQAEADKNLWTNDEVENYKYELLKTLKLNEFMVFNIYIKELGSTMRMAPFDSRLKLFIGGKSYKPVDYDKRFNFKLQGEREGLVYFSRYNEETGKPLLDGVKTVKLKIDDKIGGPALGHKLECFWDMNDDNPEKLYKGKAASKLELERLIRRLKQMQADKADLEGQLSELQQKINEVSARIDVLEQ